MELELALPKTHTNDGSPYNPVRLFLSEINIICNCSDNSSTASLEPAIRARSLEPRDSNLGSVTYFNIMRLSSDEGRRWIESRTGQKVDLDKLCALELPWANTRRLYIESTSQSQPTPELPSRVIVDRYVGLYCSSFLGLVFPVISKSLFTKTLDLAYGLRHDFGADSARSCVYAFLSVVALFGFDESMHGAMDCGSYASSAQSYMAQIIQEMTLGGLQSLIMLVRISFWLHAF